MAHICKPACTAILRTAASASRTRHRSSERLRCWQCHCCWRLRHACCACYVCCARWRHHSDGDAHRQPVVLQVLPAKFWQGQGTVRAGEATTLLMHGGRPCRLRKHRLPPCRPVATSWQPCRCLQVCTCTPVEAGQLFERHHARLAPVLRGGCEQVLAAVDREVQAVLRSNPDKMARVGNMAPKQPGRMSLPQSTVKSGPSCEEQDRWTARVVCLLAIKQSANRSWPQSINRECGPSCGEEKMGKARVRNLLLVNLVAGSGSMPQPALKCGPA